MMRSLSCSFAMLASFAAPQAQAAAPHGAIESLRACIAGRAEAGRFSGAMLVAEQGRILWQAGYGFSDAQGRIPNTPETRFNIGSLGKMFTAVAIAQLADAGRLDFEDPIARHFPDLPPAIGAITIHQLLTHTSGLRDYFRPENRTAMQAARTATDLLPLALADGVAFAPGTDSAYSNSGFVVLGAIVERLSGGTFADFLQGHIFAPAGMNSTSLDGATARATAMTRGGPGGGGDPRAPPRPAPAIGSPHGSPAGGATSTVGDLMRFGEALRAHRLTRPATTERLWQAHAIARGPAEANRRVSSGYGFSRIDADGRRFVGHGGGSVGINAQFEIDPEAQRIIVALSNHDPPTASLALQSARRALLGADPVTVCEEPAPGPGPGRRG